MKRLSSLNYEIEIEPKNSFGYTIPFRKITYSFETKEGNDNVEYVDDKGGGKIFVGLKSDSSKVKLYIKTEKTQNISIIEIPNHKLGQL